MNKYMSTFIKNYFPKSQYSTEYLHYLAALVYWEQKINKSAKIL